jgi:hypothetical protein
VSKQRWLDAAATLGEMAPEGDVVLVGQLLEFGYHGAGDHDVALEVATAAPLGFALAVEGVKAR